MKLLSNAEIAELSNADESLFRVIEASNKNRRTKEKEQADPTEKQQAAFRQGMKKGFKEGAKQGRRELIISITQRMLAKRCDEQLIAEITGLTTQQIAKVKANSKAQKKS